MFLWSRRHICRRLCVLLRTSLVTTWVLLCLLYLVLFLCSSSHFCPCFPVLLVKAPITSTSVGVGLVAASFEFVNLQEPRDLRRCTCQKGPTLLLGVPHDRRVLWDTSTEDGSSSSRHSARSRCVRRAFWCPSPSPRWPVPACRSACSLGIGSSSLAVGVPVGCSGRTSLSASSKRRLLLLPITSAALPTWHSEIRIAPPLHAQSAAWLGAASTSARWTSR